LVHVVTASIASILKTLPESCPYRVAILTYDDTLHFYNLGENLQQPQMLVVADTQDPFLPNAVASFVVPFVRSQHGMLPIEISLRVRVSVCMIAVVGG
jgi:hypothetical protein